VRRRALIQRRLAIEVFHVVRVEPRIGGELVLVHPEADHPAIHHFGWEMADPTAHEIEDRSTSRQYVPVELRHRRHRGFVDVRDKSRLAIEERIG